MHARLAATLGALGQQDRAAHHEQLSIDFMRRHSDAQKALLDRLQSALSAFENLPG